MQGPEIMKKESLPLVSVICFCKNAAATISRAIDSILAQDYPHIQVVVQDGNSSDGTLDILKSYGEKIELVSEPDNGAGDAMFRAFARVRGEYFGSCLADEQLLTHAVSWAVANLEQRPDAGAIYGDHYLTDASGRITGLVRPGHWQYRKFMCSEFMPPFCASFFRTAYFRQAGVQDYSGCGEYELWLQLGARFPVYYVPGIIARYAVHRQQLSYMVNSLEGQADARRAALERLFKAPGIGSRYIRLRQSALAGTFTWLVNCYANCQAWEKALGAFYKAAEVETDAGRLYRAGMRLVNHGIQMAKAGKREDACRYLQLPLAFPALFPGLQPGANPAGIQTEMVTVT